MFLWCFSDAMDSESVKEEASISDGSDRLECVKNEASVCEESDRCESSISADDKDESGIEQGFEPERSKTDNSATELKKELESPVKALDSPSLPLVPINLQSHLKRNDRIKTVNRSFKRVSGTMKKTNSSCENSPEKSPSQFIPSANTNKQYNSPYRTQYSRRPLAITSGRQPRGNKAPDMFGDIVIKDRFRTRSQFQTPVRRGILKHPSGSKLTGTGVKYATIAKKSKLISPKGRFLYQMKKQFELYKLSGGLNLRNEMRRKLTIKALIF